MKNVMMLRSFDYRPHPRVMVHFVHGVTYRNVLEAATKAIVTAGAGKVVRDPFNGTGLIEDARHAWTRKKRR